jgi:uncharacterized phage-associated protein
LLHLFSLHVMRPEIYTKSEIDKLGNTLVFLCRKISPYTQVSKTHLLKLIFIIEESSILKFGVPFFNLRFDLWKLGPVSKDLFVELSDEPILLSEYIGKDEIEKGKFIICPKKEFSDDEFSDNEMKLLEEVAERFKYCTAKELINFTHRKKSPWYITAQKHGLVDALEAGQINTTDIEIDLSEIIQDEKEKLALYQSHKEFLHQSKTFKI